MNISITMYLCYDTIIAVANAMFFNIRSTAARYLIKIGIRQRRGFLYFVIVFVFHNVSPFYSIYLYDEKSYVAVF